MEKGPLRRLERGNLEKQGNPGEVISGKQPFVMLRTCRTWPAALQASSSDGPCNLSESPPSPGSLPRAGTCLAGPLSPHGCVTAPSSGSVSTTSLRLCSGPGCLALKNAHRDAGRGRLSLEAQRLGCTAHPGPGPHPGLASLPPETGAYG